MILPRLFMEAFEIPTSSKKNIIAQKLTYYEKHILYILSPKFFNMFVVVNNTRHLKQAKDWFNEYYYPYAEFRRYRNYGNNRDESLPCVVRFKDLAEVRKKRDVRHEFLFLDYPKNRAKFCKFWRGLREMYKSKLDKSRSVYHLVTKYDRRRHRHKLRADLDEVECNLPLFLQHKKKRERVAAWLKRNPTRRNPYAPYYQYDDEVSHEEYIFRRKSPLSKDYCPGKGPFPYEEYFPS